MKKTIIAMALAIALSVPTAALAAPNLTVDVVKDDTPAGEPFTVTVSGTTDPQAHLKVNGHRIPVHLDGSFSYAQSVTGDVYEYDYKVSATYQGETTTITKSVYVDADPPEVSLESPDPTTTSIKSGYYLWFDWYDDADSNPTLYVNDKKLSYVKGGKHLDGAYSGAFPVKLEDGENDFTIKLVNRYGRESDPVTKVLYYNR
jgi:hypothetical protein